jgi:NAD(P)-dependent dehydrogenase (short-subunit alcohol dehydrogenase family)
MDLGLKDKVAVITGTGSQIGFGHAIALVLAQEGANVVGMDIDGKGAEETAAAVKKLGRQALSFKVDITNMAEVEEAVKKTMEKFGKIDILVNNAGLSVPWQSILEMPMSKIEKAMAVNLYGQINMVKAIAPHMIARKYGKIVNFSGGQGGPTDVPYSASKGAVDSWSLSVSRELASKGIQVNTFLPPPTETKLGTDHLPKGFWDGFKQRSPIGRMCQPEEVARMIAFMVSDANSCMMGQSIGIGF